MFDFLLTLNESLNGDSHITGSEVPEAIECDSLEDAIVESVEYFSNLEVADAKATAGAVVSFMQLKPLAESADQSISESATEKLQKLELLYEASFGDLKEKVIAGFKKVWAYIRGFLDKAWSRITQIFANDKKWVEMYKTKLVEKAGKASGFKFSAYVGIAIPKLPGWSSVKGKFGQGPLSWSADDIKSLSTENLKAAKDAKEDDLSIIRKAFLVNKAPSGKLSKSDFVKSLTKLVFGSEKDKPEKAKNLTLGGEFTVEAMCAAIESKQTELKDIKDAKKQVDNDMAEVIKLIKSSKVDNIREAADDKQKTIIKEAFDLQVTLTKEYVNCYAKAVGVMVKAINVKTAQYRSILGDLYRYGGKSSEKKDEGGKVEAQNNSASLLSMYL